MKNLLLALVFPLAMGCSFLSCETPKETKETFVLIKEKESVFCCGTDSNVDSKSTSTTTKTTTNTAQAQTTVECRSKEVHDLFLKIQGNRNPAYKTATSQLIAEMKELNLVDPCFKSDGMIAWSSGEYSGKDPDTLAESGGDEDNLIVGGDF